MGISSKKMRANLSIRDKWHLPIIGRNDFANAIGACLSGDGLNI